MARSSGVFNKSWVVILSQQPTVVGFRIPNSEIALKVLNHLGNLATTSINVSGQETLNNLEEIRSQFASDIDYLIIDECELSKVPSTVIDATADEIKVIRQGDFKLNV